MNSSQLSSKHPAATSLFSLRGLLIVIVLWVLYALTSTYVLTTSIELNLRYALQSNFLEVAILAALSVPVWWLMIYKFAEVRWQILFALHVLLCALYSWLSFEIYLLFCDWIWGPEPRAGMEPYRMWIIQSFVVLYLVQFFAYHLRRIHRRKKQLEEQQDKLRSLAREQELIALKAQLNPHFLFNTLNSISALVSTDPENSRRLIAKLADLLRYTLDSSDTNEVTLMQEIDFVRDYLEIETSRFGERLETLIEVDSNCQELRVLPMCLQPLIENAVIHGVSPSKSGGSIHLRIKRSSDELQFRLDSLGVPPPTGDLDELLNKGVGMHHTHQRLRQFYGTTSGLNLERLGDKGLRITFNIPLELV